MSLAGVTDLWCFENNKAVLPHNVKIDFHIYGNIFNYIFYVF